MDLYRIIHDGIDRGCIEKLGERVKRPLNVKSSQTLSGLKTLFPSLDLDSAFSAPLEQGFQQRCRGRPTSSGLPLYRFGHSKLLQPTFVIAWEPSGSYAAHLRRSLEWTPSGVP